VVECDLAKVEVAGSNPVSRSRFFQDAAKRRELRPARARPRPGFLPARPYFALSLRIQGRPIDGAKDPLPFSSANSSLRLVGAAGIEPATLGLEIRCSIRLSYAPLVTYGGFSFNCH